MGEDLIPRNTERERGERAVPWLNRAWPILAILGVGLAIRLCYLYEVTQAPDFAHPLQDAQFRDYWARALLTGNWTPAGGYENPFMEGYPLLNTPAYSWFLAAIYYVTNYSYLAVRIVQIVMGLVGSCLIYVLGRRLFDRTTALLAMALVCFYWACIYYDMELNHPAFYQFFMICIITLLVWWRQRLHWGILLGAGALTGLVTMVRAETLLFLFVIPLWVVWVGWRNGFLRSAVAGALLFCVSGWAVISPVTLYNYRVSGAFVPVSYTGEMSLYVGNNESSDGATFTSPELVKLSEGDFRLMNWATIRRNLGKQLGVENLSYRQWTDFFTGQAFDFIRNHPWQFLRLTARKAALFWTPDEIDENKVLTYEKLRSHTLRYLPGFFVPLGLFVLGLLFVGREVWRGFRVTGKPPKWFEPLVLILVYIGVIFTVMTLTMQSGRYRMPVVPFMLVIGAYGLSRIIGLFGQSQWKRGAFWTAAALLLLALARVHIVPYQPSLSRWQDERRRCYIETERLEAGIADFAAWLEEHPEDPYGHYNLGVLLFDAGRTQEAFARLNEALRLKPDYAAVHFNLGLCLAADNRLPEAIEEYRAFLAACPHDARGHYSLGVALVAENKHVEAVAEYRAALEWNPRLADALNSLGSELVAQAKTDDALDCFLQVTTLAPNNALGQFNAGFQLMVKGRLDEAIVHLREAVRRDAGKANWQFCLGTALARKGENDEAVKCLTEALRIDPGYSAAYANLAVPLATLHRFDEARTYCAKAVEALPHDANCQFNVGYAFSLMGQMKDALPHYVEALRLTPDDANAHFNYGVALAALGKTDDAIAQYREALRLNPSHVDALNNLGYELFKAKKLEEARGFLERALQVDSQNARADAYLADTLAVEDKYEGARDHYEASLRLDSNEPEVHKNYGYLLAKHDKVEEAIGEFAAAAALNPKDADTQCALADALLRKNRLKEAQANYEEALRLRPDFALAHNNYGDLLVRTGNPDQALKEYARAKELDPANPNTYANLGTLLAQRGQWQDAAANLTEALRLDPKHTGAQFVLAEVCLEQNKLDEAIQGFEKVVVEKPDWAEARRKLDEARKKKQEMARAPTRQ